MLVVLYLFFFWLAELVSSTKPRIQYLSVKSDLILELPQSCEMIGKAMDLGLVFCPASKKTLHDGCFYDPITGKIVETVQFKLKEEGGGGLSLSNLLTWAKKYVSLDRLDVGFQSPEDFERHQGK